MSGPPPPVEVVRGDGPSPVVLLCEHASNAIPAEYNNLGLEARHLARHIAYDVGAAPLARLLSEALDAPLFLSGYSRLLLDLNRPPGSATSIPVRSEDTDIPGNLGVTAEERARREAWLFAPYAGAVAAHLDARAREGRPAVVVGVHSFTPVFLGVARPWEAGFLYGRARAFGRDLIAALRGAEPSLTVGDNEPYKVGGETDYTVPVHGDARGLPAALIEVRQDLLDDEAGVAAWAARLAPILARVGAAHAVAQRTGSARVA